MTTTKKLLVSYDKMNDREKILKSKKKKDFHDSLQKKNYRV